MSFTSFRRTVLYFTISFFLATLWPPTVAISGDLSIKTRTKFYSFRARHFRDVSRQMLRHGPRFGTYGRKVWALAHRQYDWHLEYTKAPEKCLVKNARVRMKITYILPRMENENRVKRSFLAKWRRVYRTLLRHERSHGRNYKLLAKRLKAGLRKLKPQRNCFAIRRAAKSLDERLHQQDIRRNRRFEGRERKRFTRMQRRIERS